MTRALIIGYGSIGVRHRQVLKKLGIETAVVSRRESDVDDVFDTIEVGVARWRPDYIIIASRTEEHARDLEILAKIDFNGDVLIEKPLFSIYEPLPQANFSSINTAYNMRFHPVMDAFVAELKGCTLLGLSAHVGQSLPTWRPDTDYRQSYSAGLSGGGVLRDLSHELDYVLWLCGSWTRVTALGGHLSDLEIESEDMVSILLETEKCSVVSLSLNYIQEVAQRHIIAITDSGVVIADFINGTITTEKGIQTIKYDHNDSYKAQHTAILKNNGQHVCTVDEGLEVVNLITAVKDAISGKCWINK